MDAKTLSSEHHEALLLEALPALCWAVVLGHATATDVRALRKVSKAARARSPKQSVLVAGGRCARLIDADTGAQRLVLAGHRDHVSGCALAGTLAATSSWDGTAKLWDAGGATGALLHTLAGHAGWVNDVALSPDASLACTAGNDRAARVWDCATGALLETLEAAHEHFVSRCAFARDARRLVTASWDRTARLWSLLRTGSATTARLERSLEGHARRVLCCAFSPDGRRVATGSADRSVRVWASDSGALERVVRGHTDDVTSCAFCGGPRLLLLNGRAASSVFALLTSSADRTAMLWRVDETTGTWTLERTLRRHTSTVRSSAFSAEGGGPRVLTVGDDRLARLWDAAAGTVLGVAKFDAPLTDCAFST